MQDPLTPLTPEQTQAAETKALKENYIQRVLVADDQAINVAFGGRPDETISAHTARMDKSGSKFGRVFSWVLTKVGFGANHGAKAVAGDAGRAEAIEQIEQNSSLINK